MKFIYLEQWHKVIEHVNGEKNIAEQFTFSCHNSQDSEVVFLLVHHGSESHILTID